MFLPNSFDELDQLDVSFEPETDFSVQKQVCLGSVTAGSATRANYRASER
jgi:hypothetical protein